MKNVIKILKWIPAIFIFSCSWYLSSQEHIDGLPSFWNADKVVHCLCFAGLSFWVAFGWNGSVKKKSTPAENCSEKRLPRSACAEFFSSQFSAPYFSFLIPVAIVSIYGIVDEIHQSFTPGRESSVLDWCADTIGAILGAIVFVSVLKFIRKRFSKI